MTDAAFVAAAIVLSSGVISSAIIATRASTGALTETFRDEIRAIIAAKDQIAKTERALDDMQRSAIALYHDNHSVLRELLKREQDCIAREQGIDYRESA